MGRAHVDLTGQMFGAVRADRRLSVDECDRASRQAVYACTCTNCDRTGVRSAHYLRTIATKRRFGCMACGSAASAKSVRNAEIVRRAVAGETYPAIAASLGMTRQRVFQIVRRAPRPRRRKRKASPVETASTAA